MPRHRFEICPQIVPRLSQQFSTLFQTCQNIVTTYIVIALGKAWDKQNFESQYCHGLWGCDPFRLLHFLCLRENRKRGVLCLEPLVTAWEAQCWVCTLSLSFPEFLKLGALREATQSVTLHSDVGYYPWPFPTHVPVMPYLLSMTINHAIVYVPRLNIPNIDQM